MVDGEGGSSEGCLKWGGGGRRSLRDLSKNILKQRVGKGKNCSQGEGGLKVSPPLPPPENFNHTPPRRVTQHTYRVKYFKSCY